MESLDIKEALARLPREIVDARNQRILRAMGLSMKHEYLPKDLEVHFCSYVKIGLLLTVQSSIDQLLHLLKMFCNI